MQGTNTLKQTTDHKAVKPKREFARPEWIWGEIIEMNDPPQNFRDAMLQQQAENALLSKLL